jgi:hypothetical protein
VQGGGTVKGFDWPRDFAMLRSLFSSLGLPLRSLAGPPSEAPTSAARGNRASNALQKAQSVEGQLERKRLEYAPANQPLVRPPPEDAIRILGAEAPLVPVQPAPVQSTKYVRLKMSEVLSRFVTAQRAQGFDGRVESEVTPIVTFVIK